MRSQVQVLAGPPPIVAGQSDTGSELGALAAGLGRAGAALPSSPAPPVGPPGPPTGRQARRRPRTVVAHPAEDGSHAAGAATSRCSPLPCPPRSHPRRVLRAPAWPAGRSAVKRGRCGPHPTRRPGSATDLPPTSATWGSVARVPASSTVDRAVDGSAATESSTRSGGHGRPATSTWSQRHRLRWKDTDASGRTGQTPDGWTADGWTADGWTLDGWTADGRPPDPLDDRPM